MAHLGAEAGRLGLAEPGAQSLPERPGTAGSPTESRPALPVGSRAAASVPGPRGRLTLDLLQLVTAIASSGDRASDQVE